LSGAVNPRPAGPSARVRVAAAPLYAVRRDEYALAPVGWSRIAASGEE